VLTHSSYSQDLLRSGEYFEKREFSGAIPQEKTSMCVRKLRIMCAGGDETLAEWETETISQERLDEIETLFNSKMKQGFFAVNIADGRNTLTKKFDPNGDTLLIPPVRGG
jgi:hypothetical protein